jgi:ClpP class serine protease
MPIPETNHHNHKPTPEQLNNIDELREGIKTLHRLIVKLCPEGREQALALTELERVRHWGVESIVLPGEVMEIGDRYKDTEIIKANDSTGDSN